VGCPPKRAPVSSVIGCYKAVDESSGGAADHGALRYEGPRKGGRSLSERLPCSFPPGLG